MRKTFEFTADCVVDVPCPRKGVASRQFSAGDTIGREEVLAGCFASLERTGVLVEVRERPLDLPPPAAPPAPAAIAATEPPPPAKHKRK